MRYEYVGDEPIRVTLDKQAKTILPLQEFTVTDRLEELTFSSNKLFVKKESKKVSKKINDNEEE